MLAVIELVLPLFGLIFLGYLAGRLVKIPIEGLAWMSFFIVYLALPAMFFQLLAKTPVEQFSNLGFIAVSSFTTLVVFCFAFVVAGVGNKGNVAESTIQGFAGAYGNIGYMGPPLAIAAFGPEAGVPVALIFCFDNTLHFTLAPLLMGLHGDEKRGAAALTFSILRKIFTHPFILATIAGVLAAIYSYQPPSAIERLLEFLGNAAAPCALFAMGLTAALRPLRRIPVELSYLLPIKLIVHPVLVYGLLTWLVPELNPLWLYSAVLMAALPSATNVFVIAQQYHVWQERASSAVVLSTLVATVTVTFYIYLVKEQLI